MARLRARLWGDRRARSSCGSSLGGFPERAGPHVEAVLETEAAALRSVRGRAEVRDLGFNVQGVPLRQEKPFTIELADGHLTVPEVTWKGGETDLRLGGGILLSEDWARLRESALGLRAHGVLDLRMLNALARGLEAGGVARLQTEVNGTLARPSFLGDLRLQDAVVSYRPWRLRIDDLSAALTAHRPSNRGGPV
jgi:hypothetical protein